MTTITNELPIPSSKSDWKRPESEVLSTGETGFSGGIRMPEDRAADSQAIDQGLPRLLYELAVRVPFQPDIQALCIWLYEPVRQTIRLHVVTADIPHGPATGMDFPLEDSVAEWVWKRQ